MNNRYISLLVSLSSYLIILVTGISNFSWNISDHDDGYTVAFHTFGRNVLLQKPYAPYDSMCDKLLSFLLQDYYWVFGTMIICTLLASLFLIYILKKLALEILGAKKVVVDVAAVLFILAMPEFLYMCFTFKSVIISITFVLFAYYLLRLSLRSNSSFLFISSILVFGFGVSLRWNHLAFGFVIALDYLYMCWRQKNIRHGVIKVLIWGIGGLMSSALWIYVSGYSIHDIVNTVTSGKKYIDGIDSQTVLRIIEATLFLLPFTILMFLFGLWRTFKTQIININLMLILILSVIPYLFIGLAPSFKYLSMLWLAFFLLFVQAIWFISEKEFLRKRVVIYPLIVMLFIPLFIGVQIDVPTSNWGPGFDVKKSIEMSKDDLSKLRLDDRFRIGDIQITLAAGSAVPTSEGVRPLMGHFYTLWGGELKKLDAKRNSETDHIVELAAASNAVVWIDRANPFFLASLAKANYLPGRSWNQEAYFSSRTYYSNTGLRLGEFRINSLKNRFDKDMIYKEFKGDTIFALFTYTSEMNKLISEWGKDSRFSFERIGPFSTKISVN